MAKVFTYHHKEPKLIRGMYGAISIQRGPRERTKHPLEHPSRLSSARMTLATSEHQIICGLCSNNHQTSLFALKLRENNTRILRWADQEDAADVAKLVFM